MPTLNIQGKRVTVDDSFMALTPEQQNQTVDEIAQSMGMAAGQPEQPLPQMQSGMAELSSLSQRFDTNNGAPKIVDQDADRKMRAGMEADKIQRLRGQGTFGDSADATASGVMFGYDDEIMGGLNTPMRMLQDGVGPSEGYARSVELARALKEQGRERSPIASIVGEIGGGLLTGGTLAKGGMTLLGKGATPLARTGGAALESGLYTGANASGNADNGNRLYEGAKGFGIGALAGAGASKLGDKVSSVIANRAAAKATPAVDELASQSSALYDAARKSGVAFKPNAVNRLVANMTLAGGRVNAELRSKTAGVLDDIAAMRGKPADLQTVDELRQMIGQSMKRAEPQDVRTLQRMKTVLDNFADSAGAREVTGDIRGLDYIKEARAIYARKQKTELVEELLDLADVKTGQYTQSGMANTIRQKANALYTQIVKGKEKIFSPEEIQLIRTMAKGQTSSAITNAFAKFAPRGVVSAGSGVGIGATVGSVVAGPVGAAVGAAVPGAVGSVAARVADRNALRAMMGLRDMAARGGRHVAPQLPNRIAPFGAPLGLTGNNSLGLLLQAQQPQNNKTSR
jgi:hypothetical protein